MTRSDDNLDVSPGYQIRSSEPRRGSRKPRLCRPLSRARPLHEKERAAHTHPQSIQLLSIVLFGDGLHFLHTLMSLPDNRHRRCKRRSERVCMCLCAHTCAVQATVTGSADGKREHPKTDPRKHPTGHRPLAPDLREPTTSSIQRFGDGDPPPRVRLSAGMTVPAFRAILPAGTF